MWGDGDVSHQSPWCAPVVLLHLQQLKAQTLLGQRENAIHHCQSQRNWLQQNGARLMAARPTLLRFSPSLPQVSQAMLPVKWDFTPPLFHAGRVVYKCDQLVSFDVVLIFEV